MGKRLSDLTGIDPADFGMTDADFFEGEEMEERCEAGLRACFGIPPRDEREAAIRKDIYERNIPKHGSR